MMTTEEINIVLAALKAHRKVMWTDVDRKVWWVVGFHPTWKERDADPDEPSEPAFMLNGGVAAVEGCCLDDFIISKPITDIYDNPATVVAVVVPYGSGLLMIRRALEHGYGKLALPGGFQAKGETWQQAGAREVFEETGVKIQPHNLVVDHMVTVEGGSINLIIAKTIDDAGGQELKPDAESLEVVVVHKMPRLGDIAFPVHAGAAERYFYRT